MRPWMILPLLLMLTGNLSAGAFPTKFEVHQDYLIFPNNDRLIDRFGDEADAGLDYGYGFGWDQEFGDVITLGMGLGTEIAWKHFDSSTISFTFPMYFSAGIHPKKAPMRFRVKGGMAPSWTRFDKVVHLPYQGQIHEAHFISDHWWNGPFYGAEIGVGPFNFYWHVYDPAFTWTKPVHVMGVGFGVPMPEWPGDVRNLDEKDEKEKSEGSEEQKNGETE